MKNLRLGVIASSGGSVLGELLRCAEASRRNHTFHVITDRECGIEKICRLSGIDYLRIDESCNNSFSEKAARHFSKRRVDYVLLFFSRLISDPLFERIPCLNIHPSLLPAFKGFRSLENAYNSGVKYIGSTLHLVDGNVDSGKIIAQASMPLKSTENLDSIQKFSFIQKVGLAILSMELIESEKLRFEPNEFHLNDDVVVGERMNPGLTESLYINYLKELQQRENVFVL